MKVIKEDIENLERYIGNSKVDIHAELPLIMADAYSASKKAQEEIDKEMKPEKLDIEDEKVIGAEKQPVPKKPEEAKINLEESLFEDIFNPHRYADILTDMIDDGQFDYQDKMEKLLKDIIYLVDDYELSKYLKKKGIYSDNYYGESLREDFMSADKRWKLVEEIKSLIDEGHIDKDEFIDKLLQWIYLDPTFPSFLINNNIFHEEEVDDLLEESIVGNAKNWLIYKEGKSPKEAADIINNSSAEEIENLALNFIKKKKLKEDILQLPFKVTVEGNEYTLSEEEADWVLDDISSVHVPVRSVVEYAGNEDADYFTLTFKDGSKRSWYIHSGMYIEDNDSVDESLEEGRKASPFIDSEGNEYSDEDRSEEDTEENGLFDKIYFELCPEGSGWKNKTDFSNIELSDRYNYDQLNVDYDGNILIYSNDENNFDFAKKVAEQNNLDYSGPSKFKDKFIFKIIIPSEE